MHIIYDSSEGGWVKEGHGEKKRNRSATISLREGQKKKICCVSLQMMYSFRPSDRDVPAVV